METIEYDYAPVTRPPEVSPADHAWDLHDRLNRIRALIAKEARTRNCRDMNDLLAAESALTDALSKAVEKL